MGFIATLQDVGGAGPDGPPAVAIFGTISLISAGIALCSAAYRRRPAATAWAAVPLLLAAGTFWLGGRIPGAHTIMSIATAAVLGRNTVRLHGVARWGSGVSCVAWLASMLAARLLFG